MREESSYRPLRYGTAAMALGVPYTASVPSGTTIQVLVVLPNSGKYVWQNDPAVATLTGVYEGAVLGQDGKIRICGSNAWGCGTLPAGNYIVTLTQALPPGAVPADISPTVLIRPWVFSDYWNFALTIFGFTLWPNKYPSSC